MITAKEAKRTARKVEDSDPVEHLARFGLLCRGVIWLAVGVLAMTIAMGGDARADREGALGAIKERPLGTLNIALLALGFAGYSAWRLLEGAVGHRDADAGPKRWYKRAASAGRGLIYALFAISTVRFLMHSGGGDETKPTTARVLAAPGGTFWVATLGVVLIVIGFVMAVRGLRQDFEDKLKPVPEGFRLVVRVVGTVGLVGRGLVFALLGWFLVDAARAFEPDKAKGLDEALETVAMQPFGPPVLAVGAVSLLAFGLWSIAEARWRDI